MGKMDKLVLHSQPKNSLAFRIFTRPFQHAHAAQEKCNKEVGHSS